MIFDFFEIICYNINSGGENMKKFLSIWAEHEDFRLLGAIIIGLATSMISLTLSLILTVTNHPKIGEVFALACIIQFFAAFIFDPD